MAPVIRRLAQTRWATPVVVASGQQDRLLAQALADFHLYPDFMIPFERQGAGLVQALGAIAGSLDAVFDKAAPHLVIAQGDTTTAFAAALAAFYRRIPFVHVEAGLRSGDMSAPFPEEFHRRAVAVAAALHCAPTATAAAHLRAESIPDERILVTGNTVIDALLDAAAARPRPPAGFPDTPRTILLTAHRRESFGEPLREALTAIRTFVNLTPDTAVYFPVHPNPAAQSVAREVLANHDRIVLSEPLSYADIVGAMRRAWLVVTDSGGLQEEAPALGKPVLVLREVTERPEAVAAGAVRLVGTARSRVFQGLIDLYCDTHAYEKMAKPVFPYGDGRAAQRIVAAIGSRFAAAAAREMRATA